MTDRNVILGLVVHVSEFVAEFHDALRRRLLVHVSEFVAEFHDAIDRWTHQSNPILCPIDTVENECIAECRQIVGRVHYRPQLRTNASRNVARL